jgi:hypothetical protein
MLDRVLWLLDVSSALGSLNDGLTWVVYTRHEGLLHLKSPAGVPASSQICDKVANLDASGSSCYSPTTPPLGLYRIEMQ